MGMIKIGNQFINSSNILQAEIIEIPMYSKEAARGVGFFESFFASSSDYMEYYPVLKLVTKNNEDNPRFKFAGLSINGAGISNASIPNPNAGLILISNKKGFKQAAEDVVRYWKAHDDYAGESIKHNAAKKFIYAYGNAKFEEIEGDLESYADKLFS